MDTPPPMPRTKPEQAKLLLLTLYETLGSRHGPEVKEAMQRALWLAWLEETKRYFEKLDRSKPEAIVEKIKAALDQNPEMLVSIEGIRIAVRDWLFHGFETKKGNDDGSR